MNIPNRSKYEEKGLNYDQMKRRQKIDEVVCWIFLVAAMIFCFVPWIIGAVQIFKWIF